MDFLSYMYISRLSIRLTSSSCVVNYTSFCQFICGLFLFSCIIHTHIHKIVVCHCCLSKCGFLCKISHTQTVLLHSTVHLSLCSHLYKTFCCSNRQFLSYIHTQHTCRYSGLSSSFVFMCKPFTSHTYTKSVVDCLLSICTHTHTHTHTHLLLCYILLTVH